MLSCTTQRLLRTFHCMTLAAKMNQLLPCRGARLFVIMIHSLASAQTMKVFSAFQTTIQSREREWGSFQNELSLVTGEASGMVHLMWTFLGPNHYTARVLRGPLLRTHIWGAIRAR